ncbi:MAG: riboflavin biosynthesis protein RibF [Synergistaceae bacterium]|jgi:riboflavin kinase/FMN adenylyltransferase|nr:riboflavin biosynthesis protein RibF [Synergistaceae bacterium]
MIVVLGSFDGFHRGHALLFKHAGELASSRNRDWGVITFDPHPGLFRHELSATLFTLRERELIRRFLGVPHIVNLKFDDELVHFSPRQFWNFLNDVVEVDGIVVGEDYRFGYRRTGDVPLLEEYCREKGIPFLPVAALTSRGVRISSSLIRSQIDAGDCESAARYLGYPWFLWGDVVHGFGRGRELGFPTANLNVPGAKLLPAEGVYAVAVPVGGQWKAGALSIGKNPTFDDLDDVRVEVFILSYEGSLYEASLPVFFLSRLRRQERFSDPGALSLQIQADVDRSRTIFDRSLAAKPDCYGGFLMGYTEILKKLGYK